MIDPLVRVVNLPGRSNFGKILVQRSQTTLISRFQGTHTIINHSSFHYVQVLREKGNVVIVGPRQWVILISLARIHNNAEDTMDGSRLRHAMHMYDVRPNNTHTTRARVRVSVVSIKLQRDAKMIVRVSVRLSKVPRNKGPLTSGCIEYSIIPTS
ncbi:uncharacterized protein ACHE_20397A [Aspergillus chevalieri]|uniref:Uncharacterized protein n=1 Tax=Aspergillus chevalieri TaxID=182096 RepID=A0A7R7VJH4_ASPCH|nr:uncharacterized protein ACHE_20397A [Aspergillus chevalieri]BCR84939.1 hypothetical protein ACHE_20397A [Aspergillus chevalieri]